MPAPGFKMCNTPEGIARRSAARRAKLDALVAEMHAVYMTEGISIAEVGRRFGNRKPTSVSSLFNKRGLAIREGARSHAAHKADGSFVKGTPLTAAQVDALVESATAFHVPPALRFTWRKWSLAQRAGFLARLRARVSPGIAHGSRPTTPYSSNVEPFDYGSEHAHAIMRAANVGRNSRTKALQLRLNSEGVIFEGSLWFWTHKIGYAKGPVRLGTLGLLHHRIWSLAHDGRPVPAGHVLRFIDGNPNNLVAENLRLVTRDQVARENQAAALQKKSRALTELLLNRSQHHDHEHTATIQHLKGL
jgi:hypothetical protein